MRSTLSSSLQTFAVVFALLFSLCTGAYVHAEPVREGYKLVAGKPGGEHYPVGIAISTLMHLKRDKPSAIKLQSVDVNGPKEAVSFLLNRTVDFAIIDGLTAAQYLDSFEDEDAPLRTVTMLWPSVSHFIVKRKYARTGQASDMQYLADNPISIGRFDSGSYNATKHILQRLGLSGASFSTPDLGSIEAANAMINGKLEGIAIQGGVPVLAIEQLYSTIGNDAVFLQLDEPKTVSAHKIWFKYTIPAGTYSNQNEPIETIAQPTLLATHKNVPDEVVYALVQTLFENPAFLQSIQQSTTGLSRANAADNAVLPLHNGTLRYLEQDDDSSSDSILAMLRTFLNF